MPKRRWARALCVFISYCAAADLIPVVLLILVDCTGYLPYSDRPGPGWQHPHLPAIAEIRFYLSFVLYLGVPTLLYAAAHTFLAVVYEISSLPRWLVRVFGGLTAFLSAGLLMEGAGWMIAIAPIGVYLAAVCGLLWGVLLLPALYKPNDRRLAIGVRVGLPLICCGAGLFYLLRPLFPTKPTPPIHLSIVRITPSASPVDWKPSEFFGQPTWTELTNLHLYGEIHGGIQSGISGEGQPIDVAIVALQSIDREYKIVIPASGHVVYVLEHDALAPHPAISAKDDRTFTLKPGGDSRFEGAKFKSSIDPPDAEKDGDFTWYPTISR